MSNLRIKYGVLKPGVEPIFCIEIASSKIDDERFLLQSIIKALSTAVMMYDAKILLLHDVIETSIDINYPIGACSFLYFHSLEDGVSFLSDILNALH